jgi:hypothetical protein
MCLSGIAKVFGFGKVKLPTVENAVPPIFRESGVSKFEVIADPLVMAFFEEQTKNLSDRAVEFVEEYKIVVGDGKSCWLSLLEAMCTTSGYNKDGDHNDSYYDICRAIIKIFLDNFPVVNDGFGHRILCTQSEMERLVRWECCLGRIAESLARTLRRYEVIPGIRQLAEDIGKSREFSLQ